MRNTSGIYGLYIGNSPPLKAPLFYYCSAKINASLYLVSFIVYAIVTVNSILEYLSLGFSEKNPCVSFFHDILFLPIFYWKEIF